MKKIGILGGGQLARLLALAGKSLGLHTLCLTETATPTVTSASDFLVGKITDANDRTAFAKQVDVITFETENIPIEAVTPFESQSRLVPNVRALSVMQDRLKEKTLCQTLGLQTAPFFAVDSLADLEQGCAQLGFPCVLKTRLQGYDGKGQYRLTCVAEIEKALNALGGKNLILEQWVSFEREVSIIGVRQQEKMAFYPLIQNKHQEGILRISTVLSPDEKMTDMAKQYAEKIFTHLNYEGVLAIEFFECNQQLIVNEMAPRVHNSGHWTIEGAHTSQFENHLRAICGLPLGNTMARGYCAMFNMIGEEIPLEKVLEIPYTHFHTYEKTARPDRKLGHITLLTMTESDFQKSYTALCDLLGYANR